MARAKRYFVWRVDPPELDDFSVDSRLQTLARCNLLGPHHHGDPERPCKGGLRWVTVARGEQTILESIEEALNKARFQLFDTKPAKETTACTPGTKARGRRKR